MARRAHPVRWVALVLALLAWSVSIPPAAAGNPISLLVSNVRDTSFAVSWLTDVSETGSVQLAGGAAFQDDRGAGYQGMTHYVTLTGLQPGAEYHFDLTSGGARYDNGGAHYMVTTGPPLTPPTPDLVVGRVQHSDGSNATNAIVIFTIQQEQVVSAPISMLVTDQDNGFFHVNLSDIRVRQDPTHYFPYGGQTDLLTIQAVDARGEGTVRLPVSDPRLRTNDPSQAVVIQMTSPGEATPTLVQRLPTPTPFPPASSGETGGLIVGISAAALVVVGLLVVALLFVWRR